LTELGLPVTGKKDELVARYQEALNSAAEADPAAATDADAAAPAAEPAATVEPAEVPAATAEDKPAEPAEPAVPSKHPRIVFSSEPAAEVR
jgi:hypothetical protein